MKHFKSLLALILAFVLAFSCIGSGFAADPHGLSAETGRDSGEKTGFRSETFKRENAYQYADDEIVRAIVVLESAPLADVAGGQSLLGIAGKNQAVAAYSAKLEKEHDDVQTALRRRNVSFNVVYDFDTLLNGFSCDVAYGDLDTIADLPGVETVYIANVYHVPTTQEPAMAEANKLTGNGTSHAAGYTGQGTVVAVLDTGTNVSHEVFGVYENMLGSAALDESAAAQAVAHGVYVSAKIPFAYDYADQDSDVTDNNGHGTHVAGIAVGYAETEDGEITFEGAAPGAQLLAMKIFPDDEATTSSDIYFYAMEDALRLGADVINLSIGSPGGFTYDSSLESDVFGDIYQRLAAAGVVVCAAAGNEYSMAEYSASGYIGPEYTDYATAGAPATYTGNVSVASAENAAYPSYAVSVGGAQISYTDSCADQEHGWLDNFGGQAIGYVVVRDANGEISLGGAEDYLLRAESENEEEEGALINDVAGKIAVVSRGSITFEEKVENAAAAGAIGCIVINTVDEQAGMSIETYEIPAIMVPLSAKSAIEADDEVYTETEQVTVDSPTGGRMSDFSSWGPSPDLTISPAISSVGGNVYSADSENDSGYVLMSGTSMASPNMAGTFACVLSYLREQGVTDKQAASQLARNLLESTAGYVDDADGYLYSVRKQGAGLGSSASAVAAYENGAYIADPLVELGDKIGDSFSFDVTLENATGSDVTYTPSAVVMTDYLDRTTYAGYGIVMNTITADYLNGEYASVSYSCGDSVTVPANDTAVVTVTVSISEDGKAYLAEFVNGAFIEGYVEFEAEGKQPIHATYLGYYGDWTAAPVLEQYDFRDYAELDNWLHTDEAGMQYAAAGWSPYDFMDGLVTDFNMAALGAGGRLKVFAGDNLIDYAEYFEQHISLSTSENDADYLYTDMLYMVPYQLRNAKNLTMTVSDKLTGEVYFVDDTPYLPKSAYDSTSGYWASYGVFQYDGTDANGSPLPEGTVVHIQFDAVLPYQNARQEDCWSFDVTIDPKAPEIESVVFDEEAGTISVTASDNQYLAGIYVTDSWNDIIAQEVYSDEEAGVSHTAVFDVSGYLSEGVLQVFAVDYATNEAEDIAYLFNEGETATITLVSPAGSTRVVCKTGDTYTFQACTDEVEEDAEFLFWNSLPIEDHLDANGWEIYYYLWDPYTFYAGDSLLVTGDVTLYAIYQVGEYVELEQPIYTYYQMLDYSGDWAIVGQPYDDGYRYDDPYVLDENAETHPIREVDPDVDLSTADYNEFASSAEGFRFTFEKQADGSYTVKNVLTGRYLAYVNGELTMEDSADQLAAHWFIETDPNGNGSLMSNAANTDKLLLFNDDITLDHEMMDDKTPIINYGGKDYYPSDVYILWLYKYTDVTLETEYYTSDVTDSSTVNLPTPPISGDKPIVKPTEPENTNPCYWETFADCTDAWYHEAVDYVVSEGLMEGGDDSLFYPLSELSRGMAATILYRVDGEPAVSASSTFGDVAEGVWYSKAAAWAQETGVMNGVPGNLFAPDLAASREQVVTILWRYAGQPAAAGDLSAYQDAGQVSGYAAEAMAWAVGAGIIQGDENDLLRPAASITRAEFACVIMRYLGGSYDCSKLN